MQGPLGMPDTPVRIAAAQPHVTKRSLWLWAFSIFWAVAVVAGLSVLWAYDNAPGTARNFPIIVLSAHAMTNDREQALAAGGDEFDTKPVRFLQLLAKIEQLLTKGVVAK